MTYPPPYGQEPYQPTSGPPGSGPPSSSPPYGYPPMVIAQGPPASGLAVASLVLGIVGLLVGWCALGLPCIAAVILGHAGLSDTKSGAKSGRGMAVAGLVMGYVALIPALILFFLLGLGMIGAIFSGGATTSP
jgi:hypothetical protein